MNTYNLYRVNNCFILITFLLLFLTSCEKKEHINPIIILDSTQTNFEIIISKWQLIGPFDIDSSLIFKEKKLNSPIHYDYLNDFGVSEENFSSRDVSKIKEGNEIFPQLLHPKFTNKAIFDTCKVLDFLKYFEFSYHATIYAFCEIESDKERDFCITSTSDDGMKLWLNNSLIINKPDDRGLNTQSGMDFWKGKLKKGKNTLLVKVYNNVFDWALQVTISCGEKERKRIATYDLVKFLSRSVYKSTDSLFYDLTAFPYEMNNSKVAIYNSWGNLILTKCFSEKNNMKIELNKFKKGVYLSQVTFDTCVFKQWFYCGDDVGDYLHELKNRCDKYNDEKTRINLNGLLIRYNHLIKPENKKNEQLQWQNKIVEIIKELEIILKDLDNSNEPFKNKIGMHIRGFRSLIDDQNQYYMIYTPKSYKPFNPSPIVVVIPVITDPVRPFLKSYLLANLNEQFGNILASEKNGFIILWPGARCYTYGMPIGTTEFNEVLESVKKDYNIDEDRIYLVGACSGGLDALMFGLRQPSRFAAIASYSPVINRGIVSNPHLVTNVEYYQNWLIQNSPTEYTSNYSNLPIYDLHAANNHAPVGRSVVFNKKCKENNINLYFEIIPSELGSSQFGTLYTKYTVFDFFKDKNRNISPSKIDFTTTQLKHNTSYWLTINRRINTIVESRIKAEIVSENKIKVKTENVAQYSIILSNIKANKSKPIIINTNGIDSFYQHVNKDTLTIDIIPLSTKHGLYKNHYIEGPISHAFSSAFIFVDCVSNANENNIEMSAPCKAMFSAWKRDFFVDTLRYKKAYQVTQQDIETYNLILFGDETSNCIINRISNQLPFKLFPDKINLCKETFLGKTIGAIFVWPNPLNPNKYVVIVTSNNWKKFRMPETNLSLEAFYDFVIFDFTPNGLTSKAKILELGYFNERWAKIIPIKNKSQ